VRKNNKGKVVLLEHRSNFKALLIYEAHICWRFIIDKERERDEETG